MTPDPRPLDLDAYLAFLGLAGDLPPTRATLERLHVAHLGAIPFSNLDVKLGRPVPLDVESLVDRLVHRRRGGYCFEQNTLFGAVLRALGFRVEALEARVRPPDAPAPLPRTHMLLRVELDGVDPDRGSVVADVGFGGDGFLVPVPYDGGEVEEPGTGDRFRVFAESDSVRVVQRRTGEGWSDLYAFSPRPILPVDAEVAHHYTSTHPRSVFVNTLTAQRSTPSARHVLRGTIYTRRERGESTPRRVDVAEAAHLLREEIGLAVSDDDVRAALGG